MASEVEERIHKALAPHPLERIDDGYRLVHPTGSGVSTLRLRPVGRGEATATPAQPGNPANPVVAVAEVIADYATGRLPAFHPVGVQRLNAMAVYGAYEQQDATLRQTAQFSIYANESSTHVAVQTILNSFGAQLPLGLSIALGTVSQAALDQQRAHHAMATEWQRPVAEESLAQAKLLLQKRGLAASNNAQALWAELPLSGECPSRSLDPTADTALMQVNTAIPHPIAGAGFFSTISLPLQAAPPDAADICRRLNALELQMSDFAPRVGAWGLHGPEGLPGYSCFIPCTDAPGGMHLAIMGWCLRRTAWLRDRFWIARTGISRDALA